jgi:hypothetical protein
MTYMCVQDFRGQRIRSSDIVHACRQRVIGVHGRRREYRKQEKFNRQGFQAMESLYECNFRHDEFQDLFVW